MKDIRRKEKEIKDVEEIRAILRAGKYITIAMCENHQPYLVTLNYGYDEKKNCLYFHCAAEGKKIDILTENNNIWGQVLRDLGYVDDCCDHLYASVQFKGRVFFIDDMKEKEHALKVMIRQLEKIPEKVMAEQITADSIKKVMIGMIDIEYLSGKKSKKAIISL